MGDYCNTPYSANNGWRRTLLESPSVAHPHDSDEGVNHVSVGVGDEENVIIGEELMEHFSPRPKAAVEHEISTNGIGLNPSHRLSH